MKTFAKALVVTVFLAGFLSACNTVHGFGRDVSDTGHEIQHASR